MATRLLRKLGINKPHREVTHSVSDELADKKDGQSNSSMLAYFRLIRYAGTTWLDIGLALAGTLFAAAAGVPWPLMAILFGELIDEINGVSCEVDDNGRGASHERAINGKVIQLAYISATGLALMFIYFNCWSIFSHRLAYRLREDYFRGLLKQDQAFIDKHQAGEVSSRLNTDIQAIQSGTCEKVGMIIAALSFLITAYVVAFIKQAKLAGMLVSLLPAFLLVTLVGGVFFQKYAGLVTDATTAASNIAAETLSHITLVKAFEAGSRLESKYAKHMQTGRTYGIKKGLVAAIQAGLIYFIAYSAQALSYWQGSRMIVDLIIGLITGGGGGSSVGEIYTVVFILVDACVILGITAPFIPLLGAAAAAFEKLKRDIDHRSHIDATSEAGVKLASDSPGAIEFSNVSFAYPSRPDNVVLHNVSLKFPTGKHTAIVGTSGSGKSTIAALLTRLYDPTKGLISFDGHILTDLNVRSLRTFVSLVQQEPALLSRSILENIALGLVTSTTPPFHNSKQILEGTCLSAIVAEGIDNPRIVAKHGQSIAELLDLVRRAAQLADADTFIQQLPQAYSTVIGSDGQRLSGGQKQRVAIARALVRDPRVLILDEATASLDSLSEHRVLKAINELKGSRTVISIAHRLSTIKNADNIIVLSNGEVVEQGTYEDLNSRSGIFARMVASQSLEHSAHDYDSQANSIHSIQFDSKIMPSNADSHRTSDDRQSRISFAGEKLYSHAAESGVGEAELTASTKADLFSMDTNLSLWILIRGMGRYARPQLLWLVLATFAAVIVGLTFSSGGLIFGNTVGALTPCNTTINHILYIGKFFGGMLFMIACVEFLANFVSWSSFAIVSERLVYTIRVLTFRSLVEKSVQWHEVTIQNPSETLSVITKDCAAIAGFSGSTMGTLFSILVNFLVAIILSHIVAWKIAIVCLAMVPILLGSGILQLYSHSRFEEKSSKALTKAVGVATETVTLFTTIATFSLDRNISESFSEALSAPRKDIVLGSIYANIWLAISNSIGFFVYAFAYWWGAHQVIKGENTQKQFFIILVAMLVSAQLWGQAFALAPEVSRARSSASRIMSLINSTSNGDRCERDDALSQETGEAAQDIEKQAARVAVSPGNSQRGAAVSFRSVCFAYPSSPNTSVLENISFEVSPGQLCGLVGPSGAGKSTIIDLLQNIYNATSGSVEIDGVNVSHKDFRNEIAIVPQENALFSGTIRFNVGLGARPRHDATDEDIQEACKLAGLHDAIIALPNGYETECGPNGSHLSGGQRQRLSIARALVRKPRLLILDESTSALDAQTEQALQEGLERVVRNSGITVIAITHRLHTVQKANIIMVIEGGKLVGSGTHEQLLQTSDTYRTNAEHQMLK